MVIYCAADREDINVKYQVIGSHRFTSGSVGDQPRLLIPYSIRGAV